MRLVETLVLELMVVGISVLIITVVAMAMLRSWALLGAVEFQAKIGQWSRHSSQKRPRNQLLDEVVMVGLKPVFVQF